MTSAGSPSDEHPSADRDSALLIDSRRLHRQPGASLRLDVEVPSVDGVANDVMAVPAGIPVRINLLLESVLDGILVTGAAPVPLKGTCVRCLDDIERTDRVDFRQFFTYPDPRAAADPRAKSRRAEPAGGDDDLEDVTPLHGPWLDLRSAFHDAALLALPLTPTCRADCPGLCPECGFRMADDPEHRHRRSDPRWDSLAALRPQPEGE
jgi:uncharacterized protein